MYTRLEEVLQFGEQLINVSYELNLNLGPGLDELLTEATKVFQFQSFKIPLSKKPLLVHNESLDDYISINAVCFGFSYVCFTQSSSLDRVDNTNTETS